MTAGIKTAMILAAGLGARMRTLSETLPKPLIALGGRTLIDRVLDHLRAAGVTRIVVNTHYKAALIADHLADYPGVVLSHETVRLETGGGVRNALPLLGDGPFFVVNCDAVWLNGPTPALTRLARDWNDADRDALLLMQRTVAVRGAVGRGDYFFDSEGRAERRRDHAVAPYLFAGIQILHPRLFDGAPDGAFSLNLLYDRAEEAGRLRALAHDGEWYHVGTPEQLEQAEFDIAHGNATVNSR